MSFRENENPATINLSSEGQREIASVLNELAIVNKELEKIRNGVAPEGNFEKVASNLRKLADQVEGIGE